VTLEYTWIVTCRWERMFSELFQDAMRLCVRCARFVTPFQLPHSRRRLSHSSTPDWPDYGNSVLVGLPAYLTRILQSVLNAAARLIFHLRRSDHISDALVCLHWLRVPERVEYKIAVLTHKVLCGTAPRYLGPLNRVADVSGRRSLRSSGTNRLVVPPFRLSTVGSRAFPVAAAKIWNALPDSLVSITSLQSFRRHLKTFLFQRSFC